MTADQFAYWLQGFSELNDGEAPTPAQWASIQDHLKLVFTKVTPDRASGFDPTRPFKIATDQKRYDDLIRDSRLIHTETIC